MTPEQPTGLQTKKRHLLLLASLALQPKLLLAGLRDHRNYQGARANYSISLPKDHGAHLNFKTEWWYFTGWLERVEPQGTPIGIQITFFRNAPATDLRNPSRFTPSQLLFAHAAVALPENSGLIHDQLARRLGSSDTALEQAANHSEFTLRVDSWQLNLRPDGVWTAHIASPVLELQLEFKPTQPPWLQGERGYSKKGPGVDQASHYITEPQLETTGKVRCQAKQWEVSGRTWMDHEWSTAVLDPRASGWDWIGINATDGSALMAFVIREKNATDGASPAGRTRALWQHAELRKPDGSRRIFKNVTFENTRWWTSPKTGVQYPIEPRLKLDELIFQINPLINDQELDARTSTGTIYWEGAVEARQLKKETTALGNDKKTDTVWGRGYLELTGYWKPLQL